MLRIPIPLLLCVAVGYAIPQCMIREPKEAALVILTLIGFCISLAIASLVVRE